MEWIKRVLEKHKKEDGTVNMDAAMKEINEEFPKNAVPKDKYNDVSGQLKNANKTIEDLKKDNADNETLQKTIKEHEDTINTLKTEAERKEKESIVKTALEKEGATEAEYLIFKHGGLDKFEMDKEGNIKDLDNIIKQSKENNPTFFKADGPSKDDKKIIDNKLPGGDPGSGEEDIASVFSNALNQF